MMYIVGKLERWETLTSFFSKFLLIVKIDSIAAELRNMVFMFTIISYPEINDTKCFTLALRGVCSM